MSDAKPFFNLRWTVGTPAAAPTPAAILTPCIGICTLDADGYCEGCFRSAEEIGQWSTLADADRRRLMDEVLPAREAARSGA
ncbi:MAG: DUF1289 domain-containing protein [Xanthomonadales bacterium]|jgi:hypothetical protein|nr:DUF1289 domain-containing protein [Xanthomonadales bacterium]